MTRPAPIIAGVLAALLLLFCAYMGAYYAMLTGTVNLGAADRSIGPVWVKAPIYRGSVVDDPHHAILDVRILLLRLAHYMDRILRAEHWADSPTDFTPEDWYIEPDKPPFRAGYRAPEH